MISGFRAARLAPRRARPTLEPGRARRRFVLDADCGRTAACCGATTDGQPYNARLPRGLRLPDRRPARPLRGRPRRRLAARGAAPLQETSTRTTPTRRAGYFRTAGDDHERLLAREKPGQRRRRALRQLGRGPQPAAPRRAHRRRPLPRDRRPPRQGPRRAPRGLAGRAFRAAARARVPPRAGPGSRDRHSPTEPPRSPSSPDCALASRPTRY